MCEREGAKKLSKLCNLNPRGAPSRDRPFSFLSPKQSLAFKALSKLEGIAEAAHVIENNSINAVSKYLAETRETAAAPTNNRRGNRGNNDNQGSRHSNTIESAIKSNLLASAAHQKAESLIQDLAKVRVL